MIKKVMSIIVCLTLVITALIIVPSKVKAATEEEIEQAIEDGIEWLVDQQDTSTGAWQDESGLFSIPYTGFVLIKLEDRAIELGLDPFETNPLETDYYVYAENVIDGWEFLFSTDISDNPLYALKEEIGVQDHTAGASGTIDDPDTRVNDYGIFFGELGEGFIYYTGICLMALAASGAPDRENDGGIDYDVDGNVDTFGEIAQDIVDWLAFAQADSGDAEGGWYYEALDNEGYGADNSNSGYAVLGLAAAEEFGCTVPDWVKTELNVWIDYIQNDVSGGSAYSDGWGTNFWINELKTGNLIFEMTFYGDSSAILRFENAMDYIENHWQDDNLEPGWIGDYGIDDDVDGSIDEDPYNGIDDDVDTLIDEDMGMVHYQAIFCLMKGLAYSGKNLLDLDNDGTPEHDWYNEFAEILVDRQNSDGSWPSSPCYVWPGGAWGEESGEILSTVWALLTLEKITPQPPIQYEVSKDFRYTNVDWQPYMYEDWSGATVPGLPLEWHTTHPAYWGTSNSNYAGGTSPEAIFMWGYEVSTFRLYSDPMDTTGYSEMKLSFKQFVNHFSGPYELQVETSTDGVIWNDVWSIVNPISNIGPEEVEILLTSADGIGSSTFRISFTFVGDSYNIDYWYIDDVMLNKLPNLGNLLPQDIDGNYLVDVVVRGGKVKSTNPGQLYGVITITGPVEEVDMTDYFDYEFNVNPAKLGGGVEIIMVDPDGYATVITNWLGVTAAVDNDANEVDISIDLAEPLETGYTLMIYIKFQTSMKGQEYPHSPYNSWFGNGIEAYINDITEPFTAEEWIKLSIK